MRTGTHFPRSRGSAYALSLLMAALAVSACGGARAARARQQPQSEQKPLSKKDRDYGLQMLEATKKDLKEFYYDPDIRGMDLDARFRLAEDRIKRATSNGEIYSIIAQVLVELNDSHTYFVPPNRLVRVDYGWQMRMVGDKCFVVEVTPGSDAEAKGMKVGDEVWSIDGYGPTRENLWKIKYSYYKLRPRAGMRVVLQGPDGQQRELAVAAKAEPEKLPWFADKKRGKDDAEPPPFYEAGGGAIVWKMRSFAVPQKDVDEAMKRVLPFQSLVLDLRGNSGGYEATLLRLLGYFFDRDVKVGDLKRRRGTKSLVAKARGDGEVFRGRLVVLVDSNSASAAELFARTIQLEKRGTVVGDHSSGKVMRSMIHGETAERGLSASYSFVPFAVSITDADITMTDGRSLEGEGVAPDELLLPTQEDLARGRDPVLSRAAALAGVKLDPQQAGALFPRLRKAADEDEKGDDEDEGKDGKGGKDGKESKDKKKDGN